MTVDDDVNPCPTCWLDDHPGETCVRMVAQQVRAIQGDHYLDRLSDQADRIAALEARLVGANRDKKKCEACGGDTTGDPVGHDDPPADCLRAMVASITTLEARVERLGGNLPVIQPFESTPKVAPPIEWVPGPRHHWSDGRAHAGMDRCIQCGSRRNEASPNAAPAESERAPAPVHNHGHNFPTSDCPACDRGAGRSSMAAPDAPTPNHAGIDGHAHARLYFLNVLHDGAASRFVLAPLVDLLDEAEARGRAAKASPLLLLALADTWDKQQAGYPLHSEGQHAAAAVRLCANELRQAVAQATGLTQAGEGDNEVLR